MICSIKIRLKTENVSINYDHLLNEMILKNEQKSPK